MQRGPSLHQGQASLVEQGGGLWHLTLQEVALPAWLGGGAPYRSLDSQLSRARTGASTAGRGGGGDQQHPGADEPLHQQQLYHLFGLHSLHIKSVPENKNLKLIQSNLNINVTKPITLQS